MDEFDEVPTTEALLEAELAVVLRKMHAHNIFAEVAVGRILRGIRFEEAAGLPPPAERH